MLSDEGRTLYIGPALAALRLPGLLEKRVDRIRPMAVPDRQAAAMFRLNLEAWRHRSFVADAYGEGEIGRLADDLEDLARGPGTSSTIEWSMRQIVFERT